MPSSLSAANAWKTNTALYLPSQKSKSIYLKSKSLRSAYKGSDSFCEVIKPFLKLIKNLLHKGSCSFVTNCLRTVTQRQLNVNCRVLFRLVCDGGGEVLEMRKGVK